MHINTDESYDALQPTWLSPIGWCWQDQMRMNRHSKFAKQAICTWTLVNILFLALNGGIHKKSSEKTRKHLCQCTGTELPPANAVKPHCPLCRRFSGTTSNKWCKWYRHSRDPVCWVVDSVLQTSYFEPKQNSARTDLIRSNSDRRMSSLHHLKKPVVTMQILALPPNSPPVYVELQCLDATWSHHTKYPFSVSFFITSLLTSQNMICKGRIRCWPKLINLSVNTALFSVGQVLRVL